MWPQLTKFENGEDLSAEVLNVPIGQLGDRTAYLYERLRELLDSGKMSSVILTDVRLGDSGDGTDSSDSSDDLRVGSVVYIDSENGTFSKARATMSLYDDFKAADSAFSIGILVRRDAYSSNGDVLVYGKMGLSAGIPIAVSDMIQEGETFRNGRYYLSSNEAGKLTASPNGPLIYVCSITGEVSGSGVFSSGSAMVTPQFLDIGMSHIHRCAVLTARPAGTLSTAGYLPVSYDVEDPSSAPTLTFGGTWTAETDVTYSFWLVSPSSGSSDGGWPNGVTLYWTETPTGGSPVEGSVQIPGPGIEVPISNGMTARVHFPESNSGFAFRDLTESQRTWPALTFPEAGRGWIDHSPLSVASLPSGGGQGSTPEPHVAVMGRIDASPATVNVAFPSTVQVLGLGVIAEGSTFTYRGVTYTFSADPDPNAGSQVLLGSTLADSALYLAGALNGTGGGTFAVLSNESGTEASLVAMGAETIPEGSGDIVSSYVRSDSMSSGYGVVGGTGMRMVVYDGNSRVLGDEAVVTDVSSYVWKDIGNGLSVMVFQDIAGSSATISPGDILSCSITDFEPGAVYDYAIGFDQAIASHWPPVPVKAAALVVNGVEMDSKALFPSSPTVSFGRDTIHWFSDAEGKRPWPEAFSSRGSLIDPSEDKTEVLRWVRGFQCSTGPVTSIQVREGSPFRIVGYGTDTEANTGDLEIEGSFDFKIAGAGLPGYMVPKRARNGVLMAGPVVERIVGGPGVSVISSAGCPSGQGTVVLSLDNGAYQSQFSEIVLENAEQAKIGMFPYVRLKGYATAMTSPSAFTAMMRVPASLPDGRYELKLQASVFGENGFSVSATGAKRYACVRFTYNILPDYRVGTGMEYMNLKTRLLKPDSERTVIIPFGHETSEGTVYNGFDPIMVKTDDGLSDDSDDVVSNAFGSPIPAASDFYGQEGVVAELRPGNLVGIRISRAVTPSGYDAYTGPLGFINISWSLVSTETAGSSRDISAIASEIRGMKEEIDGKVDKDALEGVDVMTNTADGIRSAVRSVSGELGANVVK